MYSRCVDLRFTVVALGVLAASMSTRSAEACTCIQPGYGYVAPMDGAVDVPTNTKIWSALSQATLREVATQAAVSGVTTQIESFEGSAYVFTPGAPLTPGATYEVSVDGRSSRFTVGRAADTTPPGPVQVTERRHTSTEGWTGFVGGQDTCGERGARNIQLDLVGRGALTVLDLDRTSDLDPDTASGGASLIVYSDTAAIGYGACFSNWRFEQDAVGVRLGTFDLAGNFSGWSEDEQEFAPTAGCTCTQPGDRAPMVFVVGLLGFAAGGRRR